MFDVAEPIIQKLGGRVVGKEYTTGKETDFAPLIARIAATKAKVLLFALKGDGLNFIPQADDRGLLKTTTIAFLGLSETDLGLFGGKAPEHVRRGAVRRHEQPAGGQGVRRQGQGGRRRRAPRCRTTCMTHYNALMATKAAIEKAGKVDKEAMIDALEGPDDQVADGTGDDREKSSRDDEHVPRQDEGTRPRHRAGARR